jgi:uncharacterized membrane protein HdeD (DUF308 family)
MLTASVRYWWVFVAQGALGIVFGILALAYPNIALLTLAYLFAVWAIASGVIQIYQGFRVAELRGRSWPFAVLGVTSIAAGVIAAFWPGLSLVTLAIVLGAWLLVFGIVQIYAAWRIRKEVSGEWILALVGILTAVVGLVVLYYPVFGLALTVSFIAIWAIVGGIFAIVLGWRLRGLQSHPAAGTGSASA